MLDEPPWAGVRPDFAALFAVDERRRRRVLGTAAALLVIAAVTVWVHLFEFLGENTWDAAAFLTISKLTQQPDVTLYGDIWAMKPPGIFAYMRAVFASR